MDLQVGADQGFWSQPGIDKNRRWGSSAPAQVTPTMGERGLAQDLPKLGGRMRSGNSTDALGQMAMRGAGPGRQPPIPEGPGRQPPMTDEAPVQAGDPAALAALMDTGGIRGLGGSLSGNENPNGFPRAPMAPTGGEMPMAPEAQANVQAPSLQTPGPRGRRHMMQGGGGMGGTDALAGLHSLINGFGQGGY